MKNALFLILMTAFVFAVGCSTDSQQTETAKTNATAQTNVTKADDSPLVASSHRTQSTSKTESKENLAQATPPSNGTAPMVTGNAQAIDTNEFDQKILKAEKEIKQKPKDEAAKKFLGDAYAERAFALTEAAQYRSALGDFRRALKLDPSNAEAKQMHDQIIKIFKDLGREPPQEGEEPSPLPFKKA